MRGLKKEIDDFRASVHFVSNNNDSSKSNIKVTEDKVQKHRKKLEGVEINMYDTVEDMLDKQESIENQSCRNNLKLIGVPENPKEQTWDDTENIVKSLIQSELGIKEEIVIERTHRVGKPNHSPMHDRKDGSASKERPRNSVAKFQSWKI